MEPAGPAERFLKLLLSLGALATASIALWLLGVVAIVLPSRDPQHLVLWAWVAPALLVYAGLTFAFALRGRRSGWLPWAVAALSLGSLGFGANAIDRTLSGGGHFEGYLLLIGAVLAGQGLCGLTCAALDALSARRAVS